MARIVIFGCSRSIIRKKGIAMRKVAVLVPLAIFIACASPKAPPPKVSTPEQQQCVEECQHTYDDCIAETEAPTAAPAGCTFPIYREQRQECNEKLRECHDHCVGAKRGPQQE